MKTVSFFLRFALLPLFFGAASMLASVVATAGVTPSGFVPMIGFAVTLVMALVVFPEIRDFARSGAGLFTWLALSVFALLVITPVTVLAQAAEPVAGNWWQSLLESEAFVAAVITVLGPLVTALIKWGWPKIPTWLLPIMPALLTVAANVIAGFAGAEALGWWQAILLGLAGTGLREAKDQQKKRKAKKAEQTNDVDVTDEMVS